MARKLADFIQAFVLPLHAGGPLQLEGPIGLVEVDKMMLEGGELMDDDLRLIRERAAQCWLADVSPEDPGRYDLLLWAAIHNILVLDHPDRDRVWTRTSTWELLRKTTSSMLYQAVPTSMAQQLSTHLAISALFRLTRNDEVVRVGEQSRRFEGRPAPRSARRLASVGELELIEERVLWADQQHHPSVEWLLGDALRISALTSLFWPQKSAPDFDPRVAARWLRSATGARAVVYEWARADDWVGVGTCVVERLARALGHELETASREHASGGLEAGDSDFGNGADSEFDAVEDAVEREARQEAHAQVLALGDAQHHGPQELGSLLGALIHLHFLKVLALESRIGLGGRRQRASARAFLALPLLLPELHPVLGDPLVGVQDPELLRRWEDYLDHLRGLVPRDTVENLLAVFVEPVVQGHSE